jgi:predicted nucleotidyltransferase
LVEQFHPQRVILFGSQARGTADARSDADLLVICPVPPGQGSRRGLMVATKLDRTANEHPASSATAKPN